MTVNDTYEDFADRYDRMNLKDPAREAFFRQLFEKHDVSDVLDYACGTGNDLITFYSLGCNVVGSGLADAMLRQAQKKLKEAGLNLPLEKADFRELEKHCITKDTSRRLIVVARN